MQPDGAPRIGIMGIGIVGGALLRYLRGRGADVAAYDPAKGHDDIGVIDRADTVFVCVPTPYTQQRGFDDSFLHNAINSIAGSKTVVIKSTVLPGTTALMQERHPRHRFLFNPEFLREATAYDDFVNPDRQIVGTTGASTSDAHRVMAMLPRAPFELVCEAAEAEMAKYVANSFLAVKVIYANEMFDLCDRLGIDYGPVRDMVASDLRIGGSHMDVHDSGYRGYGGKCLPKDSRSLLDLAKSVNVPLEVLAAAHRVNMALRPEQPLQLAPRLREEAQARRDERAA